MADVLDQSEVDALLAAVDAGSFDVGGGDDGGGDEPGVATVHEEYNWKEPEIMTKEEQEALKTINEYFARDFREEMAMFLQDDIQVELRSVDVLVYETLKAAFSSPFSCLSLFTADPLDGQVIIELHPAIVFPVLDKLMGGGARADFQVPDRPLTSIEWRLVTSVTNRITTTLDLTWQRVAPIKFQVVGRESRPDLVKVIADHEPVILMTFEMIMGEASGVMNIAIPYRMFKPMLTRVVALFGSAPKPHKPGTAPMPIGARAPYRLNEVLKRELVNAEVEVACSLARLELTVGEADSLKVGDCITLPYSRGARLPLSIQGVAKFHALPCESHHRAAVQVVGPIKAPSGDKNGAKKSAS